MKLAETPLAGAYVVELEEVHDDRGYFARSFCLRELEELGIHFTVSQANVSFNKTKGTLRGMHLQVAPHAEAKLVKCTRGRLWDVIVDLRPASRTFKNSYGLELSESNQRQLYVPTEFAHGFLTLDDDTEVSYLMSEFFAPECGRGYRYDDPDFNIKWPEPVRVLSDRDRDLPFFSAPQS